VIIGCRPPAAEEIEHAGSASCHWSLESEQFSSGNQMVVARVKSTASQSVFEVQTECQLYIFASVNNVLGNERVAIFLPYILHITSAFYLPHGSITHKMLECCGCAMSFCYSRFTKSYFL